jgi:hypothetical protein
MTVQRTKLSVGQRLRTRGSIMLQVSDTTFCHLSFPSHTFYLHDLCEHLIHVSQVSQTQLSLTRKQMRQSFTAVSSKRAIQLAHTNRLLSMFHNSLSGTKLTYTNITCVCVSSHQCTVPWSWYWFNKGHIFTILHNLQQPARQFNWSCVRFRFGAAVFLGANSSEAERLIAGMFYLLEY